MRTVSVRALERGLAILEYLNKCNGARVTDIMEVVGAPHATTYRLLKTLRDQGLLTKGSDRGEYRLSAGVKALSSG
jgi:IclR family mhp operon transcriptional activator